MSTKCSTDSINLTVGDTTIAPNIIITELFKDRDCAGAQGSGMLKASITEGAVTGVTAGYTFKWFVGTDTTTALALANVAGVKGDSAINLASGFYTVKVTDNLNPGASCLNTKTYEVIEDNAILSVANADVTITKQTDCSPTNGSITVNSVREDGVPGSSRQQHPQLHLCLDNLHRRSN